MRQCRSLKDGLPQRARPRDAAHHGVPHADSECPLSTSAAVFPLPGHHILTTHRHPATPALFELRILPASIIGDRRAHRNGISFLRPLELVGGVSSRMLTLLPSSA